MRLASFLLVLLAVACATPAFAQAPAATEAIPPILEASAEAWNRADLDGHVAFYADSARFMTATGPVAGRGHTRAILEQHFFRGGRPVQRLHFEQIEVRALGEDHALVTGRFVLSGGGEEERSGWFTTVWAWSRTRWEAVHDHSS